MDGTKINSDTDNFNPQHFEQVHHNDDKDNINKQVSEYNDLLKRTGGVQNQVAVAPVAAAAPTPKAITPVPKAAPKTEVVYSGVGRNADREDRLQRQENELKKSERNAVSVAKYNVDAAHRNEARKALQAEKDAKDPRFAIHTRTDYGAVHKSNNQKSLFNMNMSHTQAVFLGSIFLILIVVSLAIGAFVFMINRVFKKQTELLEQQESELVYLRRQSSKSFP